ncbi:phosphotriesterase family protein [Cohnella faecalis]|uniref:Phosphotriesterase-related protein n=1 Tax=Cohnella faecalis TaxID=2315694 RepID=A0A398CH39_9BACL|nr:phosphotriesterase-related protein [Cohnella faecalis]RIE00399.1 phosphotriesterase-related protein [Cohnella faecalis]
MSFVRTVLGDVDSDRLGMVYSHEHLIISGGLGVQKNPDLRLNSVEKACEEVNDVKKHGISTFVDMMPLDCGREPADLMEIASQTGSHIIAATGFHKPMYYSDIHWVHRYNEQQIAELLVAEVEEGMDRHSYSGPVTERLTAKAGLIKGASDYNRIDKLSQKLFHAAAAAQLMTGAPISTHTEHGTCGLEQVELLLGDGVAPSKVIICHLDRNPDFEYHRSVAESGVYLEYDNIGRIKYWPDSVIIDLIEKMIEYGFEDQILLGRTAPFVLISERMEEDRVWPI